MPERKTLSASALATDRGEFTAIAAAWTIDREKDEISPGAFLDTIKAWRRSGKQMPLHWDHQGDPASIIGHIDPQSMRETQEGLVVKGQLDIENSEKAREAWRLVKNGTIGLSFGYLVPDGGSTVKSDGGRHIRNLDMFEISLTPAPMHPDTRILEAKALLEKATATVSDTPHPEPWSDSTTSNWVARNGGLPAFIQDISHDLLEKGRAQSESEAIQMAIGICKDPPKNWGAEARAKAAEAVAAWEALKARQAAEESASHGKAADPMRREVSNIDRELIEPKLAGFASRPPEKQEEPGPEPEPEPEAKAEPVDETQIRKGLARMERERMDAELKANTNSEPQSASVLRILNSMVGQAKEFLDAETDSNDRKAMQTVIDLLNELLNKESSETGDSEGDMQKSTRLYVRKITADEMAGVQAGEIKAVWSTAFVNNLPDSAFLYVAPGGKKDDEGKTVPRSLRSFPYKDADGNVDLPHLRNALARIPQSNLSQDIKNQLTAKAQKLLDSQKSMVWQEDSGPLPHDPTRRRIERAVLDLQSDGVSLRKQSPPVEEKPEASPATSEDELRRQTRDLYLDILTHRS